MPIKNLFLKFSSRESLIVLIGYGCAGVALLATLKCLTILLPTGEYGLFALGLSAQIIVVQLVFGPLGSSALRMAPDALAANEIYDCFAGIRLWLHRAVIASACVVACAMILLAFYRSEQIPFLVGASVAGILYGITHVYESILSGTRNRARAAISSSVGQLTRSIGAIIFASSHRADLTMFGYALGSLLSLALTQWLTNSLLTRTKVTFQTSEKTLYYKGLIEEYGRPFVLWAGPTAIFLASDRWSLQFFSSVENVAIFAVAQQIAQLPVNFLFQFLMLFWAPIIFSNQAKIDDCNLPPPNQNPLHRIGIFMLASSLIATFTLYYFSDILIKIFATSLYLKSAPFIPAIFLSACLYQLGQWYALDHLSKKRSDLLLFPKLSTPIAGIVLYGAGACFAGVHGLTIAMVCTSLYYFGSILWTGRRMNLSQGDL